MKRLLLALVLLPCVAYGQNARENIYSTTAVREFGEALTAAGRFGVPRYTTALLPTCGITNISALVFDTTASSFKGCDGSTWASVGGGGLTVGTTAVTSGTNGRVFFQAAGVLSQDSDLTFVTDTLTATKVVGSTSITNSSLTSGRVVISGASGIQADDSDLTFATDALTATKHRAADGTAALPTYAFTNGTNSGIYLTATLTGVSISANGADQIVAIPNYTMFKNASVLAGSTMVQKWLDTADPGAAGTGNYASILRDSAFTLRISDGGSLNGAGYGYLFASRKIVPKTTAYTVVVAEGNGIYTNEGATASVAFTLPSAAAGMGPFTFIVQDADGLSVVASTGDTIRLNTSVSATAGNAACATIGCVITISAANATEWIAISHEGTWTIT